MIPRTAAASLLAALSISPMPDGVRKLLLAMALHIDAEEETAESASAHLVDALDRLHAYAPLGERHVARLVLIGAIEGLAALLPDTRAA